MQYYQLKDAGAQRLVVRGSSTSYDLTSAKPELRTFDDLVRVADATDKTVDDVADLHLSSADEVSSETVESNAATPLAADEVWAAGVTYRISEEARESESALPELYMDVYESDRPEIFFKATPSRVVGPDEPIGIRGDSDWNVPEPELGLVLYHGDIVGYTIGNDVSSRSIEGDNPLYLPQAKVYERCCAVGPCITSTNGIEDPHDLNIRMRIERGDEEVYEGRTSTGEMVRQFDDLVSFYNRHNSPPRLAVLLTGTSLVPEDGFTLEPDDVVHIEIDGIGALSNRVTVV